jgi:hypothetical protein
MRACPPTARSAWGKTSSRTRSAGCTTSDSRTRCDWSRRTAGVPVLHAAWAARLLRAVRSPRRLRRPPLLDPPRRARRVMLEAVGGPRRACGDVPPLHARRGGGSTRARPFRGRPARPCIDRGRLRRHPLRRAAQLNPDEGPQDFDGINLWSGITRSEPFLGGGTVARIGAPERASAMVYPIRNHGTAPRRTTGSRSSGPPR